MDNLVALRSEERERMERELLAEIRALGEVYVAAAADYAKISKEDRETPDVLIALHKAATKERIAFEKYTEALETLKELVVQGGSPSDSQS